MKNSSMPFLSNPISLFYTGSLILYCLHIFMPCITVSIVRSYGGIMTWRQLRVDVTTLVTANVIRSGVDFARPWIHPWKRIGADDTGLIKKNLFENFPVTIINSTKATENAFKASPLFASHRQEFIRNSLDQEIFFPADRVISRQALSIPQGKKIIFWGATHITEPRKGFDQFLEALHNLTDASSADDYFVLIGGNKPDHFNPAIPFPHLFTGLIRIDMLSIYYNAADVVVVSSREDGGPMMIVESLMCGTPVVAFATGLGAELVITGETGYRAARNDAKDLRKGISYVLNLQPAEYASMREKSHRLATSMYGEETEMNAYKKLFAELQNRIQ